MVVLLVVAAVLLLFLMCDGCCCAFLCKEKQYPQMERNQSTPGGTFTLPSF